ncbi:hypothetical protein ACH5RR_012967 [Cinchona calisaya]|uniref:Uncharacterized protein n=1 Tax=Cinchona calisaya TaxID=153742 RepID=A0ABD3A244_9GENT
MSATNGLTRGMEVIERGAPLSNPPTFWPVRNTSCPSLHNCGVLVSVVGLSGLAVETCLPKLCNVAARGAPFHANVSATGRRNGNTLCPALHGWGLLVVGVGPLGWPWMDLLALIMRRGALTNTSYPSLHNSGVLVSVVGSSGLAVETCLPKLWNVAARGSPFHANALADGLAKREHFVPDVAWLGLACCCGWPIGMAMDGLACHNYATWGINVSRHFGRNTSCPSLHDCGVLVSVVGSSGLAVETCLPKLCNVVARGVPFHANALADGDVHRCMPLQWLAQAQCGLGLSLVSCCAYPTSWNLHVGSLNVRLVLSFTGAASEGRMSMIPICPKTSVHRSLLNDCRCCLEALGGRLAVHGNGVAVEVME